MIPENEMGVIVLFSQVGSDVGFKIESIQSAYPDAIISRDGQTYRVEFEYRSSNFYAHKHNPLDCDLVICWEHDDPLIVLPVLELSSPNWKHQSLSLISDKEKTAQYWKAKTVELQHEIELLRQNSPAHVLEEKIEQQLAKIKELKREIGKLKSFNAQRKKTVDPNTVATLLLNWKGHQMGIQAIKGLVGGRDDTNKRRQKWLTEFITILKKADVESIDVAQLGLEPHSWNNGHYD